MGRLAGPSKAVGRLYTLLQPATQRGCLSTGNGSASIAHNCRLALEGCECLARGISRELHPSWARLRMCRSDNTTEIGTVSIITLESSLRIALAHRNIPALRRIARQDLARLRRLRAMVSR